jgi:hypothetical protein
MLEKKRQLLERELAKQSDDDPKGAAAASVVTSLAKKLKQGSDF